MCGISGIFDAPGASEQAALARLAASMADRLTHRGPDDHGVWADAAAGIALGHRRLSIIDPSPSGHQPMLSRCGRYVITYNGEIYNFRALRRELAAAGDRFDSDCDTEVLLDAIAHFGLEAALERLHGMFAFAVWDRHALTLSLARDRIGQKPLYYGWAQGRFVFMSELNALAGLGIERPPLDSDALTRFLRHGYVPGPGTIYRDFFKLPAGAWLRLTAADVAQREAPVRFYWSAVEAAQGGRSAMMSDRGRAIDTLHDTLKTAVRDRLVADVPLGMFLSGGIDSSTVAALMQAQCERPVRTFSIGFPEAAYNEAHYARAVAQHLGTDHAELTVGPADVLDAVPRMAAIYDEPFADCSQVPTWLLCKLARPHVTVALTGDGGDELFFGYRRYFRAQRAARWRPFIPRVVRTGLSRRLAAVADGEDRRRKLAADLAAPTLLDMYRNRLVMWQRPEAILVGGRAGVAGAPGPEAGAGLSFAETMMLIDQRGELCDDMLVKVDRAAMAVGLEARSPLLDHRVVELGWRVPMHFKFHDGRAKWLLRQVLERYVPRPLIDRRKMGFGAPIRNWMLSPALRDWCDDLLAPARLAEEGIFEPAPVRAMWSELQRGAGQQHSHLWYVLMFQAWHQAQRVHYAESSRPVHSSA